MGPVKTVILGAKIFGRSVGAAFRDWKNYWSRVDEISKIVPRETNRLTVEMPRTKMKDRHGFVQSAKALIKDNPDMIIICKDEESARKLTDDVSRETRGVNDGG